MELLKISLRLITLPVMTLSISSTFPEQMQTEGVILWIQYEQLVTFDCSVMVLNRAGALLGNLLERRRESLRETSLRLTASDRQQVLKQQRGAEYKSHKNATITDVVILTNKTA